MQSRKGAGPPRADVAGPFVFLGLTRVAVLPALIRASSPSPSTTGSADKTPRGPKNEWVSVAREMVLLAWPSTQGQGLVCQGVGGSPALSLSTPAQSDVCSPEPQCGHSVYIS